MLNEALHATTDMAMNTGRNHGDEHLLVKFFTNPRINQSKTAIEGRPIYEDTAYIQIMQPGNKDAIVIRPATQMDKARFPEHYRKYEAREDQEKVEGTPLSEWPGISRSQCEELKYMNIMTVEQLANVSDANAQNVMGISVLKAKAVRYMDSSKDAALGIALDEQKAINAALQKRLDALEVAPKKRGRPKKVKEVIEDIVPE